MDYFMEKAKVFLETGVKQLSLWVFLISSFI